MFQGRFEPGDVRALLALVQPRTTNVDDIYVSQTNDITALSVQIMRVDSVRDVTVPMPDTGQ